MTRPLRIGLTGGIASGKSTVTQRFAELGVPVIDADVAARNVVEPGKPGLDQVVRQCCATGTDRTPTADEKIPATHGGYLPRASPERHAALSS